MLDKWVVFDLDDTLYLEKDYVASGFQAISKFLFKEEEANVFFRLSMEIFEKGERKYGIQQALHKLRVDFDDKLIGNLMNVYRSHEPYIELTMDSADFLRDIQRENRLGLITGGRPETQLKKMQALGISEIFEIVIFAGELGQDFDKPHPWSFRKFEQLSGQQGTRISYFADNPIKDLSVPFSLNWNVNRIRRPEGLYSDLECDFPITELQDFYNYHK